MLIQKPQPDVLQNDHSVDLNNVNLVQNPNLPRVVAAPGGLVITIRALRRDEIRLFYDALKVAADSGAGYGYDELPSFAYFVKNYVNHFCNVVYETATKTSEFGEDSGQQIVAFSSVGPSAFSRDRLSVLADDNAIILPEHRGKRFSSIIFQTNVTMSMELGFKLGFGDQAAVSAASLKTSFDIGCVITGSIPAAIYFESRGWIDLIIGFIPPGHAALNKEPTEETQAKI